MGCNAQTQTALDVDGQCLGQSFWSAGNWPSWDVAEGPHFQVPSLMSLSLLSLLYDGYFCVGSIL